jgi:hypothetical protein
VNPDIEKAIDDITRNHDSACDGAVMHGRPCRHQESPSRLRSYIEELENALEMQAEESEEVIADLTQQRDEAREELAKWRACFPQGPGVSADKAQALLEERDRYRGLLAGIEMELKHPMMDGSDVVRAMALAEQRHAALNEEPK